MRERHIHSGKESADKPGPYHGSAQALTSMRLSSFARPYPSWLFGWLLGMVCYTYPGLLLSLACTATSQTHRRVCRCSFLRPLVCSKRSIELASADLAALHVGYWWRFFCEASAHQQQYSALVQHLVPAYSTLNVGQSLEAASHVVSQLLGATHIHCVEVYKALQQKHA